MNWSSAMAARDALKPLGTMIAVFEGGEPLLWRDGGCQPSSMAISSMFVSRRRCDMACARRSKNIPAISG